MAGKVEALKSSLLKEGSRFIVQEEPKDGSITPHSMGYISCYDPGSSNNKVKAHVVMVRKGKGGMERIENWHIYLPVYLPDSLQERMASDKTKYYIHITADDDAMYDVRSMSRHHFLAWMAARVLLLQKANGWFNKGMRFGSGKNDALNPFGSISSGSFKNDPVKIKDLLASPAAREIAVSTLREREAESVKVMLAYHKAMVENHANAAHWIAGTNEHINSNGKVDVYLPKEVVAATEAAVDLEYKAICALIKKHNSKI